MAEEWKWTTTSKLTAANKLETWESVSVKIVIMFYCLDLLWFFSVFSYRSSEKPVWDCWLYTSSRPCVGHMRKPSGTVAVNPQSPLDSPVSLRPTYGDHILPTHSVSLRKPEKEEAPKLECKKQKRLKCDAAQLWEPHSVTPHSGG